MATYQFDRPLFIDNPSGGVAGATHRRDVPYATVPGRPAEHYRTLLDRRRPRSLAVACLVLGLLAVVGTICAGAAMLLDSLGSA